MASSEKYNPFEKDNSSNVNTSIGQTKEEFLKEYRRVLLSDFRVWFEIHEEMIENFFKERKCSACATEIAIADFPVLFVSEYIVRAFLMTVNNNNEIEEAIKSTGFNLTAKENRTFNRIIRNRLRLLNSIQAKTMRSTKLSKENMISLCSGRVDLVINFCNKNLNSEEENFECTKENNEEANA